LPSLLVASCFFSKAKACRTPKLRFPWRKTPARGLEVLKARPDKGVAVGTERSWDALLRDPALHLSTAFFAHNRGMFWLCNLYWTCEARIARERVLPRLALPGTR
jgi:hypothetical protein